MLDKDKIHDLVNLSKMENWPFPKIFDAFKKAGAESYHVQLSPFEVIFIGGEENWQCPQRQEIFLSKTSPVFDKQQIMETLQIHQSGQSSYRDFLQSLAHSGVDSYVGDIRKRTVTFFSEDENHSYKEKVPKV